MPHRLDPPHQRSSAVFAKIDDVPESLIEVHVFQLHFLVRPRGAAILICYVANVGHSIHICQTFAGGIVWLSPSINAVITVKSAASKMARTDTPDLLQAGAGRISKRSTNRGRLSFHRLPAPAIVGLITSRLAMRASINSRARWLAPPRRPGRYRARMIGASAALSGSFVGSSPRNALPPIDGNAFRDRYRHRPGL